jgi:hypothetical protein
MELDAIVQSGRADSADFTAAEFAEAERFWIARRAPDEQLQVAFDAASDLIHQWTGRISGDVGSFGTRLNLES